MTGPVIGRSRVLNTLVVAPPQVVVDEHAEAPVVVGYPDVGPPSLVSDWQQVGDPLNIGGSAAGSRPVWVGHGPPVAIEGAVILDLYLDLDTYNLYRLGG